MTQHSIKEAISMRIITVVTLVFLPAIFVSVSFPLYSQLQAYHAQKDADLLQYGHHQIPGRGWQLSFSNTALIRWLQVTSTERGYAGHWVCWIQVPASETHAYGVHSAYRSVASPKSIRFRVDATCDRTWGLSRFIIRVSLSPRSAGAPSILISREASGGCVAMQVSASPAHPHD